MNAHLVSEEAFDFTRRNVFGDQVDDPGLGIDGAGHPLAGRNDDGRGQLALLPDHPQRPAVDQRLNRGVPGQRLERVSDGGGSEFFNRLRYS